MSKKPPSFEAWQNAVHANKVPANIYNKLPDGELSFESCHGHYDDDDDKTPKTPERRPRNNCKYGTNVIQKSHYTPRPDDILRIPTKTTRPYHIPHSTQRYIPKGAGTCTGGYKNKKRKTRRKSKKCATHKKNRKTISSKKNKKK